ncbi:related to phospholipase C [Cephalotrichum gorgonifer]|uniref:Phosphoinositide phospholipase C n=1 Tax=Cephalotrichum gorgonifer TaxID=2041049 RepID=A0AAE8MRX3_9PEZI|nr:related to phospholipase C [Cephalotrichum gorgonifer]
MSESSNPASRFGNLNLDNLNLDKLNLDKLKNFDKLNLQKLNPLSKRKPIDEDDEGDKMDPAAIAGGGHVLSNAAAEAVSHLRVSKALEAFLADHAVPKINAKDPTPEVRALLSRPHLKIPAVDRSHTLDQYFVSSSHNTYLTAHQLYGTSSVDGYRSTLEAGFRCVEIDAWDHDDNKEEPKVTHGYTLVSNIPFRHVCEVVREVVDKEAKETSEQGGHHPAPILISLENHCDAHGQMRLVEIMKEVLGHRLLSEPILKDGNGVDYDTAKHVRLSDMGGKVAVIVEYHLPDEHPDSDSSSSSDDSDEEEDKSARKNYKDKKHTAPPTIIIPELAALGVYAQSVKPGNNSWFDPGELIGAPHHHLINVSESGLRSHMPSENSKIVKHNAQHLMRVFPKGTRISSRNLKPTPFWGIGAQICALNWQSFDASMQINEAMFVGTDGYVLKPAGLRTGGNGRPTTGGRKKLRLHVAGATDVPTDKDPKDIRPYLTCVLVHPDDLEGDLPKRKTAPYKQHKLEFLHRGENPPPTDPLWDETLEWEYEDSELVFLRMLIKSDDRFSNNPILGVSAVKVMNLVKNEWRFITMLDLRGKQTNCTLLVKFEVSDA